ncbi:MAG: VOC family protein [Actinobacteria bacterium]|nr:VOC family protein [Actinomycetota bacterium]
MALRLVSLTFDCANPPVLALFWSQVTGRAVATSSNLYAEVAGDGSVGSRLMFLKVPEPKTAKNRLHMDLGTEDLHAEVERLVGLGAARMSSYERYGIIWAVLRDPEGNEFCVGQRLPAAEPDGAPAPAAPAAAPDVSP